jgi:hypothetical protein
VSGVPCPAALGAVAPHAMHDHRQWTCQSDYSLSPAAPLCNRMISEPGFDSGDFTVGQQRHDPPPLTERVIWEEVHGETCEAEGVPERHGSGGDGRSR